MDGSQTVISGTQEAMIRARALAKSHGIRICLPLQVSSAFHSRLLAPAQAPFAQFLKDTPLAATQLPVISNVTALPVRPIRHAALSENGPCTVILTSHR